MINTQIQQMKKYLRSYRTLQREAMLQRMRLSDLRRAIRLPGLHADCGDPAELQAMAARRQKIMLEAMAYAEERLQEIEGIIDRTAGLSEDKTQLYRQILRLRYVDGQKFCDIAALLRYNERHVRRLHREGLAAAAKVWKGGEGHGME